MQQLSEIEERAKLREEKKVIIKMNLKTAIYS